jgi:transcriptional regulator with XRE-family HTH domain
MPLLSQIVSLDASPNFHNLCVPHLVTECDIARMGGDKNGGPNHLRAWRIFRCLTQEELAAKVGTNANMIQYLETGERGLSAKWLRRLAPELDTTPGLLLDHDPETLDSDLLEIYAHGDDRQRRQMSEIAKTLVRTGTGG